MKRNINREPVSAKVKDILDCKCRNFMPYRLQSVDDKTGKISCVLGCQMCGRTSEAETPYKTVKLWNKDNGDKMTSKSVINKCGREVVIATPCDRSGKCKCGATGCPTVCDKQEEYRIWAENNPRDEMAKLEKRIPRNWHERRQAEKGCF